MASRPTPKEGLGMKPEFQDLKMELKSHKQAEFETDDNEFKIKIKSHNAVKTTYKLQRYEGDREIEIPNGAFIEMDDDSVIIRVTTDHTGWHKLNIFATHEHGDDKSIPCVFTYLFNVTRVRRNVHPFPKQFMDWKKGFHLEKPEWIDTSCDLSKVKFEVEVTGVKKVAVIADGEWTYLEKKKNSNTWAGEVCLQRFCGKKSGPVLVNLSACKEGSDDTTFATLLQYTL